MSVLVHVCCGPCLLPLYRALDRRAAVTGCWYNPNIHPWAEYRRRLMTAGFACGRLGIPLEIEPPAPRAFLAGLVTAEAAGQRCRYCWAERLDRVARCGSERGFTALTTTLLASPHQDRAAVESLGRTAARRHGLEFLAPDARARAAAGREESRRLGLYQQNYCGCLYSEWKRFAGTETR